MSISLRYSRRAFSSRGAGGFVCCCAFSSPLADDDDDGLHSFLRVAVCVCARLLLSRFMMRASAFFLAYDCVKTPLESDLR